MKMRDRHWGDHGYVTGTVGPRGDAYAFDAPAAMTPGEAEEYHLPQGRKEGCIGSPIQHRISNLVKEGVGANQYSVVQKNFPPV